MRKRKFSGIRLIAASLLLATGLSGRAATTPGTGTIRGRVTDTENYTLPGAVIYIDQLHTGTTTDANGFYTLPAVSPGRYTLRVSYVGCAPKETSVTVREGSTLERDITLTEGVELAEVKVAGAFQGQRRAINAQKSSLGVTNVVSADQVGKFPDSNIGDALKRIAGINVQYDQGEARFGQVRGTPADMSSVTVNGNRVPSAEGGTRNVQLDLIPADMIQSIEVHKVVTPDMEGDATGGSINLVTKNSPYKPFISATVGSGYNAVSDKLQLNMGFTLGRRFFGDRLGVILAASYQNAPSGSDNVEFVWDRDRDTGELCLTDYQIRQYYVTRERQSYSAAIDYKFSADHKIYFKGLFNNRNDWENRYRLTIKGINQDEDKAGNTFCTVNDKGTVRIQTKAGTPDNRGARLERQRTMDFTLGGEHSLGRLLAEWSVNYAQASEDRPNERYLDYQLKKQKFHFDMSDPERPLFTPQEGYKMVLDDDFSLKEVTEQQESIMERDLKARLDFTLPLVRGLYGNKLKFGAKVTRKTKEKDVDFYEYTPLDKKGFNAASLAAAGDKNRSGFMPGSQYRVGLFPDKDYVARLELNDAGQYEKRQVPVELATNYDAREVVTAGYLRLDQKLGKKWSLTAGLRLENTYVNYSGSQYDEDADQTTRTPHEHRSYLDVLPSLLAKYDASDDLKLRASYTTTLSRPKYSALAPNVSVKRSDNSLSIGNPELSPAISNNLDLSGEYYFQSVGLVSAGLFYKHISDFIVDQTLRDYTYKGTTYMEFKQPRNSGSADLVGVELAWQRDLGFIAPWMKCLGVYANYTYTHSRVSDFQFEGREHESGLRLPGSPEHTLNASLCFERGGASVRLSYNYASAFIDEMGSEKFYDRYYDAVGYLDLNASYTFGHRVKATVYAEATNLLNQPLRYYQGTRERTMQCEYYGAKVNMGVKINL